ncbi:MAG: c-type cytochrome [Flavobacteriales bacterium]|nr:c-type cytochrome [Flavobacteriales bacterium]
MKKRTLFTITTSVILSTVIISCGSESTGTEEKASTNETTTEEVVEQTTEEAGSSISGEELFASSGCVACHQPEIKGVGPSIKAIGEAYNGNSEGLNAFLNGKGEAIVDPAQKAVMAPQIETTKAMSTEERNAIADYFLNN